MNPIHPAEDWILMFCCRRADRSGAGRRSIWLVELDVGAPAKFDVGLKFTDMAPSDVQRLAALLVRAR